MCRGDRSNHVSESIMVSGTAFEFGNNDYGDGGTILSRIWRGIQYL